MAEALERILGLSEDQQLQEYHEIRMKQQRQQEKREKVAREEGKAIGRAKARAKGEAEIQREIARKLLTQGMEQDEVAETMDLSQAEVAKLAAHISGISSSS